MKLELIPQPQKIIFGQGYHRLPDKGIIGIQDHTLVTIARSLSRLMKTTDIHIAAPRLKNTVTIKLAKQPREQGYRLRIDAQGILLEADSERSAFWSAQTLLQIAEQCPDGRLPYLSITDWPDIHERGFYLDVSRGRIPKMAQLKQLVDTLAACKINQLQLYIEHTFAFRGHPDIGRNASPFTAGNILELDAWCRERFIELIPSLASFGHMASVLHHRQYHCLTEDWGMGKYITPDNNRQKWLKNWLNSTHHNAFTLSPANPDIYPFLDSLFAEFLPLFSSGRFNACCDETVDLGDGQSYHLCQRHGRGRVFLNHILRLNELSHKYGKTLMFWGDIIRQYPELIPEIPKNITVLDWGYNYNHDFEAIRDFTKAGIPVYACPGSWDFSTWQSRANISGFAAAAFKHGAKGLLNTNWEYNFTEYAWPDIIFGAEQGWNTKADQESFLSRFFRIFAKINDPVMVDALTRLNKISSIKKFYFVCPGKPVFNVDGNLTSKSGLDALRELDAIRAVFKNHAARRAEDPLRILPYWLHAVDTMRHAARKLAVYGCGGKESLAVRTRLQNEFASLKKRFCKLWMERYQPSGIKIGLERYRKAHDASISFDWSKAYTEFITTLRISRPVRNAGDLRKLTYPGHQQVKKFAARKFSGDFCDLHNNIFAHAQSDIAVYFACFLHVPEPMELSACIGYDGPVKVWIDGQMIFHDPSGANPASKDKASVPFKAGAGKHEIVIAFSSNHGKAWGLFLRFARHDVPPEKLRRRLPNLPNVST